MRHMHLVSDYADLPYIREHILADALARTIKKELKNALKDLEQAQFDHFSEYKKLKASERSALIKERTAEGQKEYLDFALDYLNLVFGCGPETTQFWTIITQKCKKYYQLDSTFPPKVKPGMLLHSVLWHCSLTATFGLEVPLFKSDECFSASARVDYKCEVKTYDFPSFSIQKLFRGCPSLGDHISQDIYRDSSEKLLKLELLFYNSIKFNFQTSVAIAKMSNFKEYMAKVELENPLHPVVLPYYISNKSEDNFYRALDVLNFSLPDSHPLSVTLHLEYSTLL